ncbi:YqzE family protein [Halalkalibacterium ligniniphilum]|uniref:YqzE family protein n=1 Tax=Halalkalibacterium ligniniphilum TaxID=1134413 RepID=UPI00034D171C|nr:YqzE family protein [Halalkalibacterium ligniniphilum]
MSFQDLVKFATEQIVKHLDQPAEERKAIREEKKAERSPLMNEAFGVIPLALGVAWKKSKLRKTIKGEG